MEDRANFVELLRLRNTWLFESGQYLQPGFYRCHCHPRWQSGIGPREDLLCCGQNDDELAEAGEYGEFEKIDEIDATSLSAAGSAQRYTSLP